MTYQYVVVHMPTVQQNERERQWTDRLNAVANDGWRLVTINTYEVSKGYLSGEATFERDGQP